MTFLYIASIIVILLVFYYYFNRTVEPFCADSPTCFPSKQASVYEGTPPAYCPASEVSSNVDRQDCQASYISNLVYYPRYKGWYQWVHNLKTRPEYNRIFPPYWNTWWDPNITSDEYYRRLAADNILATGRDAPAIDCALDRNFKLRQVM